MTHLYSLLAAVLVSLQCSLEVTAQINSKVNLDNNIEPNVVATPKRRLKKFVHIYEPPTSVQHVPGSMSELECGVMGSPAPSVQWLRNGEPVTDYVEESNEIVPAHPSSVAQLQSKLVITAAASGDVFTCVATAGLKQESASTTVYTSKGSNEESELLTLQKLFRKPSKPVITDFYMDVFQNVGTDIVLPCRVSSFTKAQVFWQDSDDNLIYGNPRIRVLPSGDLLISGLRWSDMGNYTCIAKNAFGKDAASTFLYPLKL